MLLSNRSQKTQDIHTYTCIPTPRSSFFLFYMLMFIYHSRLFRANSFRWYILPLWFVCFIRRVLRRTGARDNWNGDRVDREYNFSYCELRRLYYLYNFLVVIGTCVCVYIFLWYEFSVIFCGCGGTFLNRVVLRANRSIIYVWIFYDVAVMVSSPAFLCFLLLREYSCRVTLCIFLLFTCEVDVKI